MVAIAGADRLFGGLVSALGGRWTSSEAEHRPGGGPESFSRPVDQDLSATSRRAPHRVARGALSL